MIDRATARSAENFEHTQVEYLNARTQIKNSGTGLSNVTTAGFLAEEAGADYLGAEVITGEEMYHCDLILLDKTRAEVKTKRRTVAPRDDYDTSVYEVSTHQRPDLYIFVSLQFEGSFMSMNTVQYENLIDVWLLGQKTPRAFFEKAVFWNEGDYDARNSLVLKSKTYNLAIEDLDEIRKVSKLSAALKRFLI